MELIEVKNNQQKKEFHNIHRKIYQSDLNFISHLDVDIEKVFDPSKNKFFRHGEAIRWILKDEKGEYIGRVAAFINKKEANTFEQPTGGLGFFECINNKDAAIFMFDACKNWLIQRGMEAMDGPINFGEKDKYWGLITENFDAPPYYCQNYNPPYYLDFFKDYGFKIFYNQFIYRRSVKENLQEKFVERASRIGQNPDFSIVPIKKSKLPKFTEDFREIYNKAWGAREGKKFRGMSLTQAKSMMKMIRPILDEDLTYFAYYKNEPIGFYISLPEINQVFKKLNGNFNWWGKIKFLWYLKVMKICTSSFGIAFGIAPEHQGKGLEGAIFEELGKRIQPTMKYQDIVITWIGDFNPKMIAIIESLGASKFRTMATYRKIFDESKPFKRKPIVGVRNSSN